MQMDLILVIWGTPRWFWWIQYICLKIWYTLLGSSGQGIVKGTRGGCFLTILVLGLCKTDKVSTPCKEQGLRQQLLPSLSYHVGTFPVVIHHNTRLVSLCECHAYHSQGVPEVYTRDQLQSPQSQQSTLVNSTWSRRTEKHLWVLSPQELSVIEMDVAQDKPESPLCGHRRQCWQITSQDGGALSTPKPILWLQCADRETEPPGGEEMCLPRGDLAVSPTFS